MGVIYKITSPTNKVYIGKTYDLRKRINHHKHCARKNKNYILHNSIRKYGWENHVLEILETIDDSLLNEREMYWIKEFNCYYQANPMGMNMTLGGDGQRNYWMHDIERRKKMSEMKMGEKNNFYGRKHTDETKQIISEKAVIRNKRNNTSVPKWGAEKGRLKIIRPCVAYNNKGEFIGEYDSVVNCARGLGVKRGSVTDCLLYGSWIGGEYMVRYKLGEDYLLKIPVLDIKVKSVKRAVLLFNNSWEVLKEYISAKEASEELGIPKTTINRAAMYNNGKPIKTGHIFIYKDLYEKMKNVL